MSLKIQRCFERVWVRIWFRKLFFPLSNLPVASMPDNRGGRHWTCCRRQQLQQVGHRRNGTLEGTVHSLGPWQAHDFPILTHPKWTPVSNYQWIVWLYELKAEIIVKKTCIRRLILATKPETIPLLTFSWSKLSQSVQKGIWVEETWQRNGCVQGFSFGGLVSKSTDCNRIRNTVLHKVTGVFRTFPHIEPSGNSKVYLHE